MKKIITTILLFIPFALFAQTAPPILQGSKYYEFKNALRVDSALFIPRKDTLFFDNTLKAPGMLTWRPADSTFYIYRGNKWLPILSSAGVSLALDSARRSNDTLFFRYTTGGELAIKMDYYTKHQSDSIVGLITDTLNARRDSTFWTRQTAGGNISPKITGDKVGIGLATPTAKLHVISAANQFTIGTDASNNMAFTSTNGTGSYSMGVNGTDPNRTLTILSASLFSSGIGLTNIATNMYMPNVSAAYVTSLARYLFGGAASVQGSIAMISGFTQPLSVNTSYATLNVGGNTVSTPATNVNDLIAGIAARSPVISAGGAIVNKTAAAYFNNTSTAGTKNYSILSDTGLVFIGDTLIANRVRITGNLKYTKGFTTIGNVLVDTTGNGDYAPRPVTGTTPTLQQVTTAGATSSVATTFSTILTTSSGITTNPSSANQANFGVSTSTSLSTTTETGLLFGGVLGTTSVSRRVAFNGVNTSIPGVSFNAGNAIFGDNGITTAASGVHRYIANVVIKAPQITIGTAPVLNSAALMIDSSSTAGLRNYALFIRKGDLALGTGRLKLALTPHGNPGVDSIQVKMSGDSITGLISANELTFNASAVTAGTLPILRGGTGLSSLGSSLQQLRVNSAASALEYFTPIITLDSVLSSGNQTTHDISFTDTSKLRWQKFTDYAAIQYYSTGDNNGTTNLLFTVGDNSAIGSVAPEGFIFRKDTSGLIAGPAKYDSVMLINDGYVKINDRINLNTPLLYVDRINGVIGVGNTAPTNKLHVAGSVRLETGNPGIGKVFEDTTGTGVGAWRSKHASLGTPTFNPVVDVNDFLGTGYSLTITGDGDRMQITIVTGTGISNNGTIGYINFTAFPSIPISVWSCGNVNACNVAGVGFNATNTNEIIFFNSNSFSPSTTYIYNISTGL